MRHRRLVPIILFILVVVSMSLSASAQTTGSTPGASQQYNPLMPPLDEPPPERGPFSVQGAPVANGDLSAAAVMPTFTVGATFGVRDTPFLPNNGSHIAYAHGIDARGTDLWVAEAWGRRVMRYSTAITNSSPAANLIIGVDSTGKRLDLDPGPAVRYFEWPVDVLDDGQGHLFVTDQGRQGVFVFDLSVNPPTYVDFIGMYDSPGPAAGQFDNPVGSALDAAGNLYVSDRFNNRVQIIRVTFGPYSKTVVGQFSATLEGGLLEPHHITINGDRLFIPDAQNNRVLIYQVNLADPTNPAHLSTLGVFNSPRWDNTGFHHPEGVTADNNYIYVADTYHREESPDDPATLQGRVQVFTNAVSPSYIATIKPITADPIYYATDIGIDGAGDIYVADPRNSVPSRAFRVQKFDVTPGDPPQFAAVASYGTVGVPYTTDNLHYFEPSGVSVDGAGNIFLVEQRGNRLIKLGPTGAPIWVRGTPGVVGSSGDFFNGPQGVTVDAQGRIYVADAFNSRVRVRSADGSAWATIRSWTTPTAGSLNQPAGVAIDSRGYLIVADTGNNRLLYFDVKNLPLNATNVAPFKEVVGFSSPWDVAVDKLNRAYVVDAGNNQVKVLDPNGTPLRTLGGTGLPRSDPNHIGFPRAVTVDSQLRVYVAYNFGTCIRAFDASSPNWTAWGDVAGAACGKAGDFRAVEGLDVDAAGNLYAVDFDASDVTKLLTNQPIPVLGNKIYLPLVVR